MPTIHPTASVSREAQLAPDAIIGPQCVLEGPIKLGPGTRLVGHVYLNGPVEIGANSILYPFSSVGFPGQDYKFKLGDPTAGVVIGDDCILREHATVHAATKPDAPTRLGNRVFMMAGSHVGHDGTVGNNVIMVNNSCIGGHARLDDQCTLSGGVLIHQFCRVGRLAFVSGGSALSTNVPPFCTAWGRNTLVGINLVGMRRNGIAREHITEVRRAFSDCFYRRGLPRGEMIELLTERGRDCPPVAELARFVAESPRPLATGRSRREASQAPVGENEIAVV
jgi:UDP-N-acetylglucosamine acyltransferase